MKPSTDRFSQYVYFATACDAAIVAIAAAILMFAFSFRPALALDAGAGAALIFCLRLIQRWYQLQQRGICHTEIWQQMTPEELPHEAPAIRNAQDRMEEILLRFAKGASGVSAALFAAAFVLSLK